MKYLFLLSFLLACTFLHASETDPSAPRRDATSVVIPVTCNLPAPTNFQAIEVGPDWVGLSWTPVGPQPDHYNIRVYKSSNNQLVASTTAPGWQTVWRVFNLPANEAMYAQIAPVCQENTESTNTANSPEFNDTIIDLIVSGFTPDFGGSSCVINQGNLNCSFSSASGTQTSFKITNKAGNTGYFRMTCTGNGDYQMTKNSNPSYSNSCYTFQCSGNGTTCPQTNIKIYDNGSLAADLVVVSAASGTSNLSAITIGQNHNIERTGSSSMRPSNDGGIRIDDGHDASGNLIDVSPNPFNDRIRVDLAPAMGEKTVQIYLYDLQGKMIETRESAPGDSSLELNTETLKPGMYVLKASYGDNQATFKVFKTH